MDPAEFEDEDGTPSSYHLSDMLQELFGPIHLKDLAERVALAESETDFIAKRFVFPQRTHPPNSFSSNPYRKPHTRKQEGEQKKNLGDLRRWAKTLVKHARNNHGTISTLLFSHSICSNPAYPQSLITLTLNPK
jgi:hypothetical protein